MYFIACLFYILKMEWRKITWDCAPLSPVLRHPRAATSHSNRQSARRVARGTATWRRSHRKSHHLSWGCDKRWQEMTIWVEKAFTYFVWGKMLVCPENWLWYTMIIYACSLGTPEGVLTDVQWHVLLKSVSGNINSEPCFLEKTVSPNCCKVFPRASLMQYDSKGKWDIMGSWDSAM
jgi:hypothetical protein